MGAPTLRRVLVAAAIALSTGLGAILVLEGPSFSTPLRVLEGIALVVLVIALVGGILMFFGLRMAGWSEPESEAEFERLVQRSERLAREGVAADPEEREFMALDPYDDDDFAELVRDAMDELPDLLQRAPTACTTATAWPATTSRTGSSSTATRCAATSATTRRCCATRSPAPSATSSRTISAPTSSVSATSASEAPGPVAAATRLTSGAWAL